ncbi:hypothetical protein F5146DRAFT_666505, partial [Armillaria mellea]
MQLKSAISRLPRYLLVRLSDNAPFVLKSVEIGSPEFEISVLFSSPPLSLNARNHCIPILDVLKYENHVILVLPLSRLVGSSI